MSVGGRCHETTGAWLVRVKNLRVDDRIHCASWSGGEYWYGGEILVVSSVPESTGLRDGYYEFWVYAEDCPGETRQLCIRPDDEVTLGSRRVVESKPPPPTKKPKKGQLSLF